MGWDGVGSGLRCTPSEPRLEGDVLPRVDLCAITVQAQAAWPWPWRRHDRGSTGGAAHGEAPASRSRIVSVGGGGVARVQDTVNKKASPCGMPESRFRTCAADDCRYKTVLLHSTHQMPPTAP